MAADIVCNRCNSTFIPYFYANKLPPEKAKNSWEIIAGGNHNIFMLGVTLSFEVVCRVFGLIKVAIIVADQACLH